MSDFAKLSAGDGTIFLVRWRGRQEGPYAGPAIAAKLAANEIGLLHEIYFEGKWITVRDYMALREAALRTEPQAEPQVEENVAHQPPGKLVVRPLERRLPLPPPPPEVLADEEQNDELLAAQILSRSEALAAAADQPSAARPRRGRLLFVLGIIFLVILVIIFFCARARL